MVDFISEFGEKNQDSLCCIPLAGKLFESQSMQGAQYPDSETRDASF
ncbi:hypothetical protein C943_04291 [Mariniradius saccharolyticus AK6]|uniref:Uncharacterized protein n=1 Tax=Mariniradius saccharolyticus AK6 TaxID=1239962 RepID=M7XZP2_9BACT|nr:hypothetical protein C943_04291 [Mariniradius saccharolyticus AK6]